MELLTHHRRHHPAKAKAKQSRENKPPPSKLVVDSDFKTELFASTSASTSTTTIITRPPKPRSSSLEPLNLRDTTNIMNSSSHHHHQHHHPSHHHEHHHHDVHQQRLLWFFSFCNQRSSSSSSSSNGSGSARRSGSSRRKSASSRNKFAAQYQQQLQQQQRQSSNVFGRDLIEHAQLFGDDDVIPYIVKSCTKFIEKHGIIFGIYRLSGMRVNIHKLRQDFDKNPKISMIDNEAISNDAHAVACVLKQYFRELPTPLLTFHMYEKFIELFKHSNTATTTTTNLSSDLNDSNIIDTIDGEQQNDVEQQQHDNYIGANKSATPATTTPTTTKPTSISMTMTTKSKSSATQPIATTTATAAITTQKQKQSQFTSSASDSQLISLSSVVTTTTSDIKYQVKLGDLKGLLLQLPKAHYQTLKFLMRHLACIAANGKKTGMDSKNVAIVWAPNLLKPRQLELSAGLETLQVIGLQAVITEQLIKHHKFLFDDVDAIDEGVVDQIIDNDDVDAEVVGHTTSDRGAGDDGEIIEETRMATTKIDAQEVDNESHRHHHPCNNEVDDDDDDDDDKIVQDDKSVENIHNLQTPTLEQSEPMIQHKDQEQTSTTTQPKDIEDKQDIKRDENGENKL